MDPYEILGVERNASDAEIKKAYRRLSRIYHPDANVNNPNRAVAEEKFKEVQKAYETLMKERTSGAEKTFGDGAYGRTGDPHADTLRQAAINFVRYGRYQEALRVLSEIRPQDGWWHYLSAVCYRGLGDNMTAIKYAETATQMEPDNAEYRFFLNSISGGGFSYTDLSSRYGGMGRNTSSWCLEMCALNLCLNMCCTGGACCMPFV